MIWQGTAGNTALAYKFIYNGDGDLYELRNYKTLRATFFEYDHAGRCMASTEKSFTVSGNAVTYTGTVSGYRYEYDANNNLTKLTCNVNGSSWDTTYTYDKDNRPISALLDNGRSVVNTYDAIGRLTSRAIKNGSVTVRNTAITYVPGADGSKTSLVASYQNGSDAAYSYTYDANGNITGITQGTASFTYEYDKANQLIRENLYYGSGDSNNATYTYEYDAWGNILNRKKYAYTTGTLGSVLNTKTYGYTNTQWGDLLTSYNGQTIAYDAMGNMATYGSKSYSWEGKQLVEINVMNSLYYTFSYDENGLRTSKTATWVSDNTSVATEYYYNGSVLIGMKTGSTVMRFSYDASGNVVSIDYSTDNGTNFTTYYYLRNAQSDIVKIIDGSGNAVVEYTYDSWGKPVSVTGSLSGTLGEDQPFRYRGYVYDSDTQLYYLQSRYYDPKICRFISADVYLSTGQGVIGHNSFAYCLNNPMGLSDHNGSRATYIYEDITYYIFYTAYKDANFSRQAKYYAEKLQKEGKNVLLIQTDTVDDFVEAWRSMLDSVSGVMIFSHGNGNSLIFKDGGISATGKNKAGEEIMAIRELAKKHIGVLYLMSCNSGHKALYEQKGFNAAVAFKRAGLAASVRAFDGSMGFGYSFFSCVPVFKARLAFDQSGYRDVYSFYNLENYCAPSGWCIY